MATATVADEYPEVWVSVTKALPAILIMALDNADPNTTELERIRAAKPGILTNVRTKITEASAARARAGGLPLSDDVVEALCQLADVQITASIDDTIETAADVVVPFCKAMNKELDDLVVKAAAADNATKAAKDKVATNADKFELQTAFDRSLAMTARIIDAHDTIKKGHIEIDKTFELIKSIQNEIEANKTDETARSAKTVELKTAFVHAIVVDARIKNAHNTIAEGNIELNKIFESIQKAFEADVEAEVGHEAKADVEAEVGHEAKADVEAEVGHEAKADVEAEVGHEAKADVEAEVGHEAKADVEAEVGHEAKADVEAEVEEIVLDMIYDKVKQNVKRTLFLTISRIGWDADIPQIIDAAMPAIQKRVTKAVDACLGERCAITGRRPYSAAFVTALHDKCMQKITDILYKSAADTEP